MSDIIRVKMAPDSVKTGMDGVSQVVRAYMRHMPEFGFEYVPKDSNDYDIIAAHAGWGEQGCDVSHCHGLYWTADYWTNLWVYRVNQSVIQALRHARTITVPSDWVAETLRRDMHIDPRVIPHGIEWDEWQNPDAQNEKYVLWNKNRTGDVCDPSPPYLLAALFPGIQFVSTYAPPDVDLVSNLQVTGLVPHDQMKTIVQNAGVYLATTKETFGIGILEAMASGVPVLGVRHGGIMDLVEHGVTGYLGEVGNVDDLAEGLAYCIQYRDVLGDNAREAAKRWKWEDACALVADAYRTALENVRRPGDVSVVIPCHNKSANEIARAIDSVIKQEFQPKEIIIVDDGSDDPSVVNTAVSLYVNADNRQDIRVIQQPNRGVAHARNAGIAAARTKYVCCLDADDAIHPEFLKFCVNALNEDASLGIAYTGITWIDPQGKSGLSDWPPSFNYDAMLRRQNQVPTCCVFRKDAWARLGGYRQRYAPLGAGSEDANLWLRMGAIGYNARKVTDQGLFLYSLGSGQVSGNKSYREVDWLAWHPWAKDAIHPFASIATTMQTTFSHPVKQYDTPRISVIIPVGPGHESEVVNALDSLEAQTFRNWEAIVVWDCAPGHDFTVGYEKAFPYARNLNSGQIVSSEHTEPRGAGHARNLGVGAARADLILFLDADDWLYPEALSEMLSAWNDTGAIVYTDYVGRAIIKKEDEDQLDPKLRARIYARNEKTDEVVIGHKSFPYDCELAQAQPTDDPYIWTNVTCLIPRKWHNDIGGFDESLPSWEDVEYHWRMARAGRCYFHLEQELLVYNFHKGGRRDKGRQDFQDLLQWIREKYQKTEGELEMCSGCPPKGRATAPRTHPGASPSGPRVLKTLPPAAGDFVLCRFNDPNIGDHLVIGGAVFPRPLDGVSMSRTRAGWRINYQYHGGGDEFYVHRADIEMQPSLFVPLRENPISTLRERTPQPGPPPRQAQSSQAVRGDMSWVDPALVTEIADPPPPPAMAPDTLTTQEYAQRVDVGATPPPPRQVIHDEKTDSDVVVPDQGEASSADGMTFALQSLPGVGPVLAQKMIDILGLSSLESIVSAGVDGLVSIPGVSDAKATAIVNYAVRALETIAEAETETETDDGFTDA